MALQDAAPEKGTVHRVLEESGYALLRGFLASCDRPRDGVYGLFLWSPTGLLKFVCFSGDDEQTARFPETLAGCPVDPETGEQCSPGRLDQAVAAQWIHGLSAETEAAWQPLERADQPEGVIVLCWPSSRRVAPGASLEESGDPAALALSQLHRTAALLSPVLRLWESARQQPQLSGRLRRLEELAAAVESGVALDRVLKTTCEAILESPGVESARIYLLGPELGSGNTQLRGGWSAARDGSSGDLSTVVIPLPASAGPGANGSGAGWERVLDQQGDPNAAVECGTATTRIPLRSAGMMVGLLEVTGAPGGDSAVPAELESVRPFAAHAAAAIHHAWVHERLAGDRHRAEEMERRQKHFERDVILAVTDGKLHLCDWEEIQGRVGQTVFEMALGSAPDVGRCRQAAAKAAVDVGLPTERRADLELCLGEAATNCFQHAGGGETRLHLSGSILQLLVSDTGPGIKSFLLPRATLQKGYSTKTSLGVGFSLILALCDRLYLATSDRGTSLLIEMTLEQQSETDRLWEQLGLSSSVL